MYVMCVHVRVCVCVCVCVCVYVSPVLEWVQTWMPVCLQMSALSGLKSTVQSRS